MRISIKYFLFGIFVLSFASLKAQKKIFSVEDIFTNPAFYGKSLRGVKWFDRGKKFSFMKYDTTSASMAIFGHDVESGEENVIVTGKDLQSGEEQTPVHFRYYRWSPDSKKILFTTYLMPRYSKPGGDFYIYNLEKKSVQVIPAGEHKQWVPGFSPDSKKLAYVKDDNLFVYDLEKGTETQLTFDGNGLILNGHFDWVYQEELGVKRGWRWSPDSKKIAFWRLDQSKEPEIKIAKWDSLYFNFLTLRYPKAGGNNALVKIGVLDVDSRNTVWLDLGKETDIYIPRIKFTNNPNVLSVQRLNRLQNHLELLFYNVNTGQGKVILEEKSAGWIDVRNDLYFLKNSEKFIWSSERDGFRHLYLFDNNGNLLTQLTKGKWEIKELVAVNEAENKIYFTANKRNTINLDFYSVDFDGKNLTMLSAESGYYSVNMANNSTNYILNYRSANNPSRTMLFNGLTKIKDLIVNNFTDLEEYEIPDKEFLQFETSDGVKLNAFMIKPPHFNASEKYPVLFYNYSGPGSQIVTDARKNPWHILLAQRGYIIFGIDQRGTGGRGAAFKHIVYKKLGTYEVNDLVEAVKFLSTLEFIDTSRIGIWGWSYGGYTSALTLAKAPEYFKMAISVAPVTDWKFYDNIYTERYMSLPSLNPGGYKNASVLEHASNIKGKLLLIHGTADDNVHFQNSVELVNKLIDNNIQFETMFYPERNHSIYGGNTRIHLYNLMLNFILKNL